MKVLILGTGYVGLVSGSCLAERGHKVTCFDINSKKIEKLNNLEIPIHEKGLKNLIFKNLNKNLFFTDNLKDSLDKTDLAIICVGTPVSGKKINLNQVKNISKKIGIALKNSKKFYSILVKSTVIPGTTDEIVIPILEKYSQKKLGKGFGVGMNPEFLKEGSAVSDFMNPDRIVIGSSDKKSKKIFEKLYEPFSEMDFIKTNNRTAETIKYVNNSLLATLISFSNEIGNLCSSIEGVDAIEVMKGVHLDNRLSPIKHDGERIVPDIISYLKPGCGYGGSCFPKDTKAFASFGATKDLNMQLINSVIEINNSQHLEIIKKIKKYYKDFSNLKISILGLSFKPETDDIRESPSIKVIKKLKSMKSKISVYDPIAMENTKSILGIKNIKYCKTLEEACRNSDIILVLTAWNEFKDLNKILKKVKKNPLVIDGRRFLNKNKFKRFEGIGV